MRLANVDLSNNILTQLAYGASYSAASVVAAVAAANSQAQLYNTAIPPTITAVLSLWVSIGTAGDVTLGFYNTALTTDDGAGNANLAGLDTSYTHARHATNAGLQGTMLKRVSLPAGQSVNIVQPFEFGLINNRGLIVQAVTVNIPIVVSWSFAEIQG